MSKLIIHFSHANGFPAPTYRKFLRYLEPNFDIGYVDQLAHNPKYPVTDNWHELVEELIAEIKQRYDKPIIGVGHSLGGALSYMAALKSPELFKAVVLLDTPMLGPVRSKLVALAKYLGLINYFTPAARTKNRRVTMPDAQTAYDYFKSKPLFQHFDPDCLRDYVDQGMEKTPEGLKLKFSPQIEYQIFRTLPHHFPADGRVLQIPGALIYGENSDVMLKSELSFVRRRYHMFTQATKGSHLFPFEYPELSAIVLTNVIQRLLS